MRSILVFSVLFSVAFCWHSRPCLATLDIKLTKDGTKDVSLRDVDEHLTAQFVDPEDIYWTCVDGRNKEGMLGTPGGDFGEFLLGLRVYHEITKDNQTLALTKDKVVDLLEGYLGAHVTHERQFYMHTDSHALEALENAIEDEYPANEFDIIAVPDFIQARVHELLAQPAYTGCGHLRKMITYPDTYDMPQNLTQWAIFAYFDFMWNHENSTKLHLETADFQVLEGEHAETAWVHMQVEYDEDLAADDACNGLVPMLLPFNEASNTSMFADHLTLVSKGIRGQIATFFSNQEPSYSRDYYLEKMNEYGNSWARLTVSFLGPSLADYTVTATIHPTQKWSDSTTTTTDSPTNTTANLPDFVEGVVLGSVICGLTVVGLILGAAFYFLGGRRFSSGPLRQTV